MACVATWSTQLAGNIDIDMVGRSFARFAGSDDLMDIEEFDRFTKQVNITRQQSMQLWLVLDKDGSGAVSKEEFMEALANLQQARSWLRYCPDCIYSNTCAYCLETNANCANCNENTFCAACWADHPAHHRDECEEGGGGASAEYSAQLPPSELLRTHLFIRPLNWAYTSPMMAWLPVAQKAMLRQALRAQQQAVADSLARAQREEEAVLAMR